MWRRVLAGDLAYLYAGLAEPVLTVVGEPLGMIHLALTYHLPNDSFGRWNPVLEALGLGVVVGHVSPAPRPYAEPGPALCY